MNLTLFEILDGEARSRMTRLLVASAFAGGLSALMIPMAMWGIQHETDSGRFWFAAVLYALALGVGFYLRSELSPRVAVLFEEQLADLQNEMLTRLRRTSLRRVERDADIAEAFTRDLETLANLPRMIDSAVFSIVLLIGLTFYLATYSLLIFLLWLIICLFIGYMLWSLLQVSFAAASDFDRAWTDFSQLLDKALTGAAQLKLDARVAAGVRADMDRAIDRLSAERVRRDDSHRDAEVQTELVSMLALFIVLFLSISLGFRDIDEIISLTAILLFADAPLCDLVQSSQFFIAGEVAWRNLREWRERVPAEMPELEVSEFAVDAESPISESSEPSTTFDTFDTCETFETIVFKDVSFDYGGEFDFQIGPINTTFRCGELVFLVGGNGSGKTTLIKLLAGLYPATTGTIRLDGARLFAGNLEAYRSLFTLVLAEHRLFARSYGLNVENQGRVDELLKRFALRGVTGLYDEHFTELALSSDQAKRLAMVVALLEDRPVLLLDEWAAYQDPELRSDFYNVLLPELKAQGKTIIAASHDSRYFHLADRVIRVAHGRIEDDSRPDGWRLDRGGD